MMKRVLYFTKCSGYEHSVVQRENGAPSHSERVLAETGPRHGIEFTFSKDGRDIAAENLPRFDAVMFFTSGNLVEAGKDGNPPMTPAGKAALLDAVACGRLGFVGIHSATDTFHADETTATNTVQPRAWRHRNLGEKADPYTRMVGAEFIVHDEQQVADARIVDPRFPGIEKLGGARGMHRIMEEWYSHSDFGHDLHVILATETAGMSGPSYQRPPFPNTWARLHGRGGGRVFYTALGHREDMWLTEDFQRLLFGGISWAVRNVDADITPNIARETPGAWTLPPVGDDLPEVVKADLRK